MRLDFRKCFGAGAFILLLLLFWAVWASAQPANTNAAGSTNRVSTNAAGAKTNSADRIAEEIKAHKNTLTFGLDNVDVLNRTVMGHPLWKYLASLIYVFLAFYVSRFLDFLTSVWLKRWSARTGKEFNELFARLFRGPIKVVAFIVFLSIGLDLFDWGPVVQTYLSKGFVIVVAISLTYVTLKIVDLLVGLWRKRTAGAGDKVFDEHLFPVISKSLKIFVVVVAVLVTASNLQINITGVLASLSVGALAVGLAAQDTLANLFGAIAVYADKPFRIGDVIRLDSVEGMVESIGLRSTRVRNSDGNHVTIPNKTVGNATITNITRRSNIKSEFNFALALEMPVEKIRRALAILEETFRGHPKTADLTIAFNKFTESALNILVVHWWTGTDGKAQLAGMQELNLAIKTKFDAEGIRLAYPTRTVHLMTGPADEKKSFR